METIYQLKENNVDTRNKLKNDYNFKTDLYTGDLKLRKRVTDIKDILNIEAELFIMQDGKVNLNFYDNKHNRVLLTDDRSEYKKAIKILEELVNENLLKK